MEKVSQDTFKKYNHKKMALTVPELINLKKFSVTGKPIKPVKDARCLNCEKFCESFILHEINFKSIIESHDNRKRDKNFFLAYDNASKSKIKNNDNI